MKKTNIVLPLLFVLLASALLLYSNNASAQSIPAWIKNTALWYGQGNISETEFLNAIKFLIENDILVIERTEETVQQTEQGVTRSATVIIPNGNANIEHTGFYIPLNQEVKKGTTVVWVNEDTVPHTVQSIDEKGNIIGLFNSAPLKTGERFAYTFEEEGTYNYFCSLHPWRVGLVTVK